MSIGLPARETQTRSPRPRPPAPRPPRRPTAAPRPRPRPRRSATAAPRPRRSATAALAFARAAPVYWGAVYPQVCLELELQRRAAAAIPDSRLRSVALAALRDKRSNVDGAAAFAAFAPAARRAPVIRAQVAFQALYDYLDTLAEQPHADPVGNSRELHGALAAALAPGNGLAPDDALAPRVARRRETKHVPGCAYAPSGDDAGYLRGTVQRCQAALRTLPSYPAVQPAARKLAAHIISYQSFNVTDSAGPREALAAWARAQTPVGSDLRWWETAASAGSSLGVFALIAMAARLRVSAADAAAVEHAYFPWIGALHSLLDSLIDREEDEASGQPSLIGHYAGARETARRLALLATESRRRAAALPDAGQHVAILASMASLYLSEREARLPEAREARSEVLHAIGALAAPAMLVLRARALLRERRAGG